MGVEKVGQDEGKKSKATCNNCGAMLDFYPRDVLSQALYSGGEYDGSYGYVVCPECKERVKTRAS